MRGEDRIRRMKLSEMTGGEQDALGSLICLVVGADGATSPEESSGLQEVAVELGEDDFWTLVRKTHAESYSRDAVLAQARAVERKDAQQQIYNVVFSIASEGSIMGDEGQLLGWLANTWDIDMGQPDSDTGE